MTSRPTDPQSASKHRSSTASGAPRSSAAQSRTAHHRTAQCLISFGSNLGDRHALIARAARLVTQSESVLDFRASRLFETPPIGGPGGQEPFLNAVAAFDTPASAHEILQLLQKTETQLGRQRLTRWDARSIDLDVVLHGQLVGGGTALSVPHPRYTARQFVLQPACDVASHYRDPRFGWTLRQLTDHLNAAAPSMALAGGDDATRRLICERLSDQYKIQSFLSTPPAAPMAIVGNAPAPRPRDRDFSSRPGSITPVAAKERSVPVTDDRPWVSAFVPGLPRQSASEESPRGDGERHQTTSACFPRLIARIQTTTPATRWPAPHQMWPSGWKWPEYRLEIDDFEWAVSEIASALDSMRCEARAVSEDGQWWC